MARPRDPLSPRNSNTTFTGAEVQRAIQRLAKSKQARNVRVESEFSLSVLRRLFAPPAVPNTAYSWDLSAIMAARDQQIRGNFAQPVRLAESMRTDDAIHVARKNRLAPQRDLAVRIVSVPSARGEQVAHEAGPLFGQNGIAVRPETTADVNGFLADHGISVGYNVWLPRSDGSRLDVEHHVWPLETVWWDSTRETLVTWVTEPSGATVLTPIVHGDGRWVVYKNHELTPWRQDAAVLAGAVVWAGHAFAARDWAKGSATAGNAKVVGELAEGVPMQITDDSGNATSSPDVINFLALLQDIASLDTPVGIKPSGSKVDMLANPGNPWEVFERLMVNREKAAARIYLGTDGTMGSMGGAPGVDITALFGVARTIVSGDLGAIERGVLTGIIEPWCALNFGDSSLAPKRQYVVPQPDSDAVYTSFAARNQAFLADVAAYRAQGFVVDQDVVDSLAEMHGVSAPVLAVSPPPSPTVSAAADG